MPLPYQIIQEELYTFLELGYTNSSFHKGSNWQSNFAHQIKRMTDYIKKPHTTIFTSPMGCGKTHLVSDLIKKQYNKLFDYIIIICPTLRWNKTYRAKDCIKNDDKVWLVEPKDRLYQWIEKLSQMLTCSEILFIIDDVIADEDLDKKAIPIILAISGRHRYHYLWLPTQSYSAIPKNLRRQSKAIFVWYPKERADLKMINDEINLLTDDESVTVRDFLRTSQHACLYIPNEHPHRFKILSHV